MDRQENWVALGENQEANVDSTALRNLTMNRKKPMEQLLEVMPQSEGRAQKRDPLDRADNAYGWEVSSQLFYKFLDNFHLTASSMDCQLIEFPAVLEASVARDTLALTSFDDLL